MSDPKNISDEDIKYLSDLIRIEVDEATSSELKKSLGNILKFVSKIDSIDVSGLEPLFSPLDGDVHKRAATPMMEDSKRPSQLSEQAMVANAPEFRLGHFVVPRVIDD
ncbi:aspartyl/glutamyl-tRNA(Asn/Gln) amidotransferase subunit C [Spirochaetota bacterium]|nr:aspartyl/glutamyl-tRNA(Asn/Gln) amidotransferase subunit C [Spirochaetota bacterium]